MTWVTKQKALYLEKITNFTSQQINVDKVEEIKINYTKRLKKNELCE